jgi:hypothetical protein
MTWKATNVANLPSKEYVQIVGGEQFLDILTKSPDWAVRSQPFKTSFIVGVNNLATYKVKRHTGSALSGTLFSRFSGTTVDWLSAAGFHDDIQEAWYNSSKELMRLVYNDGREDFVAPLEELENTSVIKSASLFDAVRVFFEAADNNLYLYIDKENPVELLPGAATAIVMWIGHAVFGVESTVGMLHEGMRICLINGAAPSKTAVATMRGIPPAYLEAIGNKINKIYKQE